MNKALVWLAIIVVSWVAVILEWKLVAFLFHLVPLVTVFGIVIVVWRIWCVDNPNHNKDFK